MALSSEAYSTCVRRKFMRRNKSKIPSGPISSRSFAVQIASESISGAAGRGPKSSRDFVWLLRFTQIADVYLLLSPRPYRLPVRLRFYSGQHCHVEPIHFSNYSTGADPSAVERPCDL